MVDFGGWDMPLHYGSQVEEHHQVRRDCGVFDVSHMTVVDVAGPARLVVQGGDLEALGAGWQPVRLGAGIGWLRPGEA